MSRFPSLADDATVIDAFAMTPELAKPILEYHQILLRGPSPLSVAQRELIAAFVSGINACRFCHGAHTAVAEAFGVEPGLVQQLLDDVQGSPVSERMKPILAYVRKLTEAPASVRDADAEAVFAAGWDELALHHAIHVCALFNYMNRLVEGHGIEPAGPEVLGGLTRQLHDKGYVGF